MKGNLHLFFSLQDTVGSCYTSSSGEGGVLDPRDLRGFALQLRGWTNLSYRKWLRGGPYNFWTYVESNQFSEMDEHVVSNHVTIQAK